MSSIPLLSQSFPDDAKTLLPKITFFDEALKIIPLVYQQAEHFIQLIFWIAAIKQNYYDILRSLCNVYNLYSSDSDNNDAVPKGIYLKMLASNFGVAFNEGDSDLIIFNLITDRINSVVSRGTPKDFYNYFSLNNLGGFFTNLAVQETGNATIFFDVPIPNTPSTTPNPYVVFQQDMFRIKGAGIKIVINSTVNIPYFQLADLFGNVAPENAGYAGLDEFGQPIGGGFYAPLP